jgi:leader peptidase (prepilin peptidase)/N-methyltransferase
MEVPMIIFWITLIMVVSYKVLVENNLIMSSFSGAIIAMAFFWILVFISKEKWMGWGDVYVGFLSGFLLGWPNIFLGLFLSFFIGAICAIILLFGDKNMKSQIPFVPFLVVGTILTIFLVKIYPDIINYFWLQ